MLLDIFKEKRCFKLILGAGNQNLDEVEKLVYVYSLAGCNLFDLSADKNVLLAAKKGLEKAGIKNERYLCISVGTNDDIHLKKAEINPEKCIKCNKCAEICPQDAINNFIVDDKKCIGCSKCLKECEQNALFLKSDKKDLKEILPPLIDLGIDMIEFHTSGVDKIEAYKMRDEINLLFKGPLGICTNRSKLSNEDYISFLNKLIENKPLYSTVIQADGAPMSGGCDDFKTTLQTVAAAEIIQNANLPVFIILSGGTNSKSSELAKLCGVNISGVSIGSYARKIVKEAINQNDFETAVKIAKNLVDITVTNMK